jgi:DNA replication protein DnaC
MSNKIKEKIPKIKLIKNKDINLEIPDFTCDENVVGKHLEDHPLTKLLNTYGFVVFCGKPGQGKTSLATAMICQKNPKIYRKTHHKVIIMMPPSSIASMKKNPFSKLPPENFIHELTDATITQLYNDLVTNTNLGQKTLLFIDDMTADLKKSKLVENMLAKIVFNRRHLKCNIIITTQSYSSMPLPIRKLITNIFIFKPAKKEMEILFEELVESKKKLFVDIMKLAYEKDHNFLFINITSQRMFTNFDEIIIDDEDEDNGIEKNIFG